MKRRTDRAADNSNEARVRLLLVESDRAVCVGGKWDGWLFWLHPDGNWISARKLPETEPTINPLSLMTEKDQSIYSVLLDFTVMAKNEVQRIQTGCAPGPSMRDVVGQWQATIREAEAILAARQAARERWLKNPDYPAAE